MASAEQHLPTRIPIGGGVYSQDEINFQMFVAKVISDLGLGTIDIEVGEPSNINPELLNVTYYGYPLQDLGLSQGAFSAAVHYLEPIGGQWQPGEREEAARQVINKFVLYKEELPSSII